MDAVIRGGIRIMSHLTIRKIAALRRIDPIISFCLSMHG
jgi:hypothetical protein